MSEDIWGPWIEHDGGPRPVPRGTFCHLVYQNGDEFIGPIGTGAFGHGITSDGEPWGTWNPVRYYRIRRPKGLTILENLIAEIPEEVAG